MRSRCSLFFPDRTRWSFIFILLVAALSVAESLVNETVGEKELDCGMRTLAYGFASDILDPTANHNANTNHTVKKNLLGSIRDALEISRICTEGKNSSEQTKPHENHLRHSTSSRTLTTAEENDAEDAEVILANLCNNNSSTCIFVSTRIESSTDHRDGSRHRPWTSIQKALDHSRLLRKEEGGKNDQSIVLLLRQGVHYLDGKPLRLSQVDNNLVLRGYPGEEAWMSGGIPLGDVEFKPATNHHSEGVFVADLTDVLHGDHIHPKIPSLFTTSRRYFRARFPDGDPEVNFLHGDRTLRAEQVLEWTKPPPGIPPNFTFFDFATNPPPGVPSKTDSTMDGYNQYGSGHGGACSDVWGEEADSYWCSNSSQGGWAEVDRECALSGQMQLPAGMEYNRSDDSLAKIHNATSLEGGFVFAWHSQSWAMHMFEITSHTPTNGTMTFAKGGGKQGGRNWCRCDQCTYAGGWCGQRQTPPNNDDTRLISGEWMIENVLDFLDQPGEYYFDKSTLHLYVKPNSTEDLNDLTLGVMTEMVDFRNCENITVHDLGFRDQAATFMDEGWSAPSGGDWSLLRRGALFIQNSTNITIRGCNFFRLDGNAIFLSRKTRHVHIQHNQFEWIGENAIATWGDTDGYDATKEEFPMHTLIEYNVMRELGIYEKQSSAVGHSKAALTTIRKNIMFNMPRAAINFNDMVGGGDIVEGNLIFNTCRESGDHGPINSWDRQAYLTTIRDGKTPSFDARPRTIRGNFIIANYNAAEGVDNDDGSSWFHIHHNVFYQANGFKMDYGGHDSVYEYNMAISLSYHGGPCFGMGSFREGHGDVLRGNKCLLGIDAGQDEVDNLASSAQTMREAALRERYGYKYTNDEDPFVGRLWGGCVDSHLTLESNEYYTPDGIAMVICNGDEYHKLEDMAPTFGLEINSTVSSLPDVRTILVWAEAATNEAAFALATYDIDATSLA